MSKIDFETAKAALTKLGCEYGFDYEYRGEPGVDRKRFDLPRFSSVSIPFSAETWVKIARNDGEFYIGGCCANSSACQDLVDGWFRFAEEWAKPQDLSRLAFLQESHDGSESLFATFPDLLDSIEKGIEDPWAVLAAIWHLVKDHHRDEVPRSMKDHVSPLEKALTIVSASCTAISWSRLLNRKDDNGNPLPISAAQKVDRALLVARFLPAFKTVNELATDLYFGPVEGFAILEKEGGPKAIVSNLLGYCIYETKAEVEEIFDRWDENDALHEERRDKKTSRERFETRPVRVTLENGIVFTDTGERYEGKNA